jgi:heme/copper-type cytochrome/quinol oxidase subunit 2
MAKKDQFKGYDTIGLVFAVIALLFSMTVIFGILFGFLGLYFVKYKRDTQAGRAARILSIVSIIISFVLLGFVVFSFMMAAFY